LTQFLYAGFVLRHVGLTQQIKLFVSIPLLHVIASSEITERLCPF